MTGTYLTFEFNRLRRIDDRFLKVELAINSNTPVDYLRELYYSEQYHLKEEVMTNPNCPFDLYKNYYSNIPTNKRIVFIKNIHIPQDYIQFIINHFLKHELADKRHLESKEVMGIGNAMMIFSINGLVECLNITNRQLIEIYIFMENDESLKKEEPYYSKCINNVKRKIQFFDEIDLKEKVLKGRI